MDSEGHKPIRSYRDLLVWQRGIDLVVMSYQLSKRLPAEERYGLSSQMQRAAVSVPANISEGHGRKLTGEYLHHLAVANGSLMELETHLEIAVRLRYLSAKEIELAQRKAAELGKMLARLMEKLRARRS